MSFDESSILTMSEILDSKFKKLEIQIDDALTVSSKLDVPSAISLYHQVLNVSSIIQIFGQIENLELNDETKSLINNVKSLVSQKFNLILHPKFLAQLSESITDSINELKTQKKFSKN